jgi:AraC-like DNA-binding protein
MIGLFWFVLAVLGLPFKSKLRLQAENAVLRHQLIVLRRSLQDALERLEAGVDINLSSLAQDLGYFDQAHFTRDFKRVTGVSPGRY